MSFHSSPKTEKLLQCDNPCSKYSLSKSICKTSSSIVFQFLYICLFSTLGNIIRIFLGQVFGAACESGEDDSVLNLWFLGLGNPDIVPCVTSGGSALFLDLPANIVGSFLMGLFLGSTKLDRAMIDVPVPILPRSNRIQFRPDIQIGIRTGLCGSLTTFSGWNTQMVLLMVGANRDLRIYDAIFGYIIGLSAAMSSFVAGKHLAMAVFCWVNGDGMSKEMEEMAANPAMSIVVNQQLCDFERRFMLDILTDQDYKQVAEFLSSNVIEDLKQWKSSTDADRW
eukprot:CAMPEP_0194276290 /NCGR_PEP_ID=MMETSP0169-20130528/8912_1 /TAXON_ID=218684 /ORGANISM="Corethron pennatum, Strain L29A3" /LENGTH=280 /DNA_ID=CAMNT_0039019977 /DNA_START=278 /DNA_END=1117 /DNA_ORIENTATION=+